MMRTSFFELPLEDRKELLTEASQQLGRNEQILEKDVWVCWVLNELFNLQDIPKMAFKGGTSLSKAYHLIHRFSEDIDVTLDYRNLAEETESIVENPPSRSQGKKLSAKLRDNVTSCVHTQIGPHLETAAEALNATVEIDDSGENLKLCYPSAIIEGNGYLLEHVLVEFGGRNITEPASAKEIEPDMAVLYGDISFPKANPLVLDLRRTFWEKVTAIHSFVNNPNKEIGDRLARHWYDVHCILTSEHFDDVLQSHGILKSVVEHKNVFYYASYAKYENCLQGDFKLIPEDSTSLKDDYHKMIDSGLFYDEPPTFDELLDSMNVLVEKFEPHQTS